MIRILLATAATLAFAAPAHAQFTGGVFPPTVNGGASQLEYRIAVDPDGPFSKTQVAQRLHYQASLSDRFQLRGVVATRTRFEIDDDPQDPGLKTDSIFDFDFVQAELTWQITPDDRKWQTGLRFDGRLKDEGRNQVGVNWTNQWSFDDGWQARAILLSAVREDDDIIDDLGLSARGQLSKRVDSGQTLGLQVYSSLGTPSSFRPLSRNGSTVAGPYAIFPVGGDGVYIRTGALFGLSEGSRDTQLRLWLGKNF